MSAPEEPSCGRFHAAVSLHLDGELPRLEAALHSAHALRCADCRAYAAAVRAIAAGIRGCPLRTPSRRVVVPTRAARAPRRALSTAALVVTALLAAGLGTVGGSVGTERPRARDSAYLQSIDDERRLLAALSRRASSSPAARS